MKNWATYQKYSKNFLPNALMLEAFKYLENPKDRVALDFGAGALQDTKFLLKKGMHVFALDALFTFRITHPFLTFITSKFEDAIYTREFYDLISAQSSLPFISPYELDRVFASLRASLKVGGIITGEFFGPNHTWNADGFDANCITLFHAKQLLQGLEIIKFTGREYDESVGRGPIHWHIFEFIARKV